MCGGVYVCVSASFGNEMIDYCLVMIYFNDVYIKMQLDIYIIKTYICLFVCPLVCLAVCASVLCNLCLDVYFEGVVTKIYSTVCHTCKKIVKYDWLIIRTLSQS